MPTSPTKGSHIFLVWSLWNFEEGEGRGEGEEEGRKEKGRKGGEGRGEGRGGEGGKRREGRGGREECSPLPSFRHNFHCASFESLFEPIVGVLHSFMCLCICVHSQTHTCTYIHFQSSFIGRTRRMVAWLVGLGCWKSFDEVLSNWQ